MIYGDRITIEPGKRSGKPCIRGLRITVSDVLGYLAGGMSEAEILADFPDLETCVAETVRRQLTRPFARSAEREEQVIRTRFHVYVNVPAVKVETMPPPWAVVDDIVAAQAALLSPR